MRKIKKTNNYEIKLGGVLYTIRPLNEIDLLGVSSYIPVFDIDREHETNWLNKAIDEQNEKISQKEKDDNLFFLKHIVYRCTLDIKPSILSKIANSNWRKDKENQKNLLMSDLSIINFLYKAIYLISYNIASTQKINITMAESIYSLYKGMNYADEYFKDTKLNALEKYSFNRVIHNAGVTAENRRAKANG